MPKEIKVIVSEIKRGAGVPKGGTKYTGGLSEHVVLEDDMVRLVTQYHTLDGEFLAEVDSRTEKIMKDFNKKEMENK